MATGQTFGHYRVLEQIGAGGMGVVYRAHDEHLDRDVAVKVLPSTLATSDVARRRFRQEAHALSRLNHSNIAIIHDFDTFGGVDVLVMELVPGATLNESRSSPRSEREVLAIAIQLASGLQAAHDQGIVHRDLKPGNLRLMPDGRLKILDFGLALLFEASGGVTHTATDVAHPPGTLRYMAPELLLGAAPTPLSDIYSAGVAIYELLTGQPPFTGQPGVLMGQILHRAPEPPSAVLRRLSPALDSIVLKAMDRRPERRYQSARELMVDLQRHAEGVAPSMLRPRRVSRRYALVTGGVATAAAAGLAWRLDFLHMPRHGFPARGWAVVADFDNQTGDPLLDQTVHESLTLALQQSAYVNVFTREQLFEALRRMRRETVKRVDEALALEICRRESAQVVFAGSVLQSGSVIRITARVIAATGDLLFGESVDLGKREDLFRRIDELAAVVRERLGESLSRIQQTSAPLDKVTTGSLEALRVYTQAMDAIARGSIASAMPLLQAAISLDPDFALAHRQLARALYTAGRREEANTHLAAAYALRDAVTSRERYFIEAAYYSARERYDDAAQSLGQLVALYPDDSDAQYELNTAQYAVGRIAAAVDAARRVVKIRPNSAEGHEALVLLLARQGKDAEALSTFEQAIPLVGRTEKLRWGAGMSLLGLGRLDEARRTFRELESLGGAYAGIGRLYATRTDMLDGRFKGAIADLSRDVEQDAREKRTSAELLRRYLLARLHMLSGRLAEAKAEALEIAAAPAAAAAATNVQQAALLFSRLGDLPAVRELHKRAIETTVGSPASFTRSCVRQISGEIATLERRWPAAEAEFTAAAAEYQSHLSHMGLARVFEAQGRWEDAGREWQSVLESRGEILRDGFPPDLVLAWLGLGHARENQGQTGQALQYYQHVVDAWREADLVAPLADARSAIRRLAEKTPQ